MQQSRRLPGALLRRLRVPAPAAALSTVNAVATVRALRPFPAVSAAAETPHARALCFAAAELPVALPHRPRGRQGQRMTRRATSQGPTGAIAAAHARNLDFVARPGFAYDARFSARRGISMEALKPQDR